MYISNILDRGLSTLNDVRPENRLCRLPTENVVQYFTSPELTLELYCYDLLVKP